jgi:hypothetical protein
MEVPENKQVDETMLDFRFFFLIRSNDHCRKFYYSGAKFNAWLDPSPAFDNGHDLDST